MVRQPAGFARAASWNAAPWRLFSTCPETAMGLYSWAWATGGVNSDREYCAPDKSEGAQIGDAEVQASPECTACSRGFGQRCPARQLPLDEICGRRFGAYMLSRETKSNDSPHILHLGDGPAIRLPRGASRLVDRSHSAETSLGSDRKVDNIWRTNASILR